MNCAAPTEALWVIVLLLITLVVQVDALLQSRDGYRVNQLARDEEAQLTSEWKDIVMRTVSCWCLLHFRGFRGTPGH